MADTDSSSKRFNELVEELNEIINSKKDFTKSGNQTINKILSDSTFKPSIAYIDGLNINDIFTTITYQGKTYQPNPNFIPFITTKEFDPTHWNLLIQDLFFPERNKEALEKLEACPNGTVACIEGLFYKRQEGYTGVSSAGRDFNVDHIKCADDSNISPGHFHKYSKDIFYNQIAINYAIEYANSDKICGGTIKLKNDSPYKINSPIKLLDGVTLTGESDIYSNDSRLATLVIDPTLTHTSLGIRNDVLAGMILDNVKGVNIKGIEIDMENAPDRTIGMIITGYNFLEVENINIFNVHNDQIPIFFVMKDNLGLLYGKFKNLFLSADRNYEGIMCLIQHEKYYGGNATSDRRIGYTTFENLRTLYGKTSVNLIKPGASIVFNNLQMRKGNKKGVAFICKEPLAERPQICGGRVNDFQYGFPSNNVTVKDYSFRRRTIPFYDDLVSDKSDPSLRPDFSIGNDQSQYRIINSKGSVIHNTSSIIQNKIVKKNKTDYRWPLSSNITLLSGKHYFKKSAHYMCNLDIDIPGDTRGFKGYIFQVYIKGREGLFYKEMSDEPLSDTFGSENIKVVFYLKDQTKNNIEPYKDLLLVNKSKIDIRVNFTVTGSVKDFG